MCPWARPAVARCSGEPRGLGTRVLLAAQGPPGPALHPRVPHSVCKTRPQVGPALQAQAIEIPSTGWSWSKRSTSPGFEAQLLLQAWRNQNL